MYTFFIKLFILAFFATANIASAAENMAKSKIDTEPDYAAMIGTGQFSCGQFVQYKEAGNKDQLDLIVQWTWGFMSAYNIRGSFGSSWQRVSHLQRMPDSPTVILYIESYCRKYPTEIIENSVLDLIRSMGGEVFGIKK